MLTEAFDQCFVDRFSDVVWMVVSIKDVDSRTIEVFL